MFLISNKIKQTPMLYKNILVFFILGMGLSANLCHAQDHNTKAFLFLSVFCEESDSYYEQSADIIKRFDTLYENFTYECTKPLAIPTSRFIKDSLMDYEKYTIQLFKIKRTRIPSYYIMRIASCDTYLFSFPEELWIRICGYRESDLKVFFDALKKRGVTNNEISEMVESWCDANELFREIDWNCLMNGYFKNDTHSSCYASGSNIWYKARYLGEKNDIYAVFSSKPLAGILLKLD